MQQKLTRKEKKIDAVAEAVTNKLFNTEWQNDQAGTPQQIELASRIYARLVTQKVGGSYGQTDENGNEENPLHTIQVEDLLQLQPVNASGFMWHGGTGLINQTNQRVNALGIKCKDKQKEEEFETAIELACLYGDSVLGLEDNRKWKAGNIIEQKKDKNGKGTNEVVVQLNNQFKMFFDLNNGEINRDNYKNKFDTKTIDLNKAFYFKARKVGTGDIAGTAGRLPILTFFRFMIIGEGANCISKILQKVKDPKQSRKEAKKFRNIFKRFITQEVDQATGEAINKITTEELGAGVSKQLMDLINLIKFLDEDYAGFIGMPSGTHKRQALAGELASSQTKGVYEYNAFAKRVKRFAELINDKYEANPITFEDDIQPQNYIGDLKNGGQEPKSKADGNTNAEKSNPETRENNT